MLTNQTGTRLVWGQSPEPAGCRSHKGIYTGDTVQLFSKIKDEPLYRQHMIDTLLAPHNWYLVCISHTHDTAYVACAVVWILRSGAPDLTLSRRWCEWNRAPVCACCFLTGRVSHVPRASPYLVYGKPVANFSCKLMCQGMVHAIFRFLVSSKRACRPRPIKSQQFHHW